jgi:hypothetical protein
MVSSDEINRKLKNKKDGIDSGGLKCSKCGTENTTDSIYCMECGGDLNVKNVSSHVSAPLSSKIQSKREKIDLRKTNDAQNDFKSIMRKIPGFRSGTPWKMGLSSIGYILVLIILIAIGSTAFVNTTPSFEVAADAPITIIANNSSTVNGMMINATIRDTGSNISVLPVEVYSAGTHIGDFFITNVTSGQNVWFNMNLTNESDMIIDSSQNNSINLYPDKNSSSSDNLSTYSSYSMNPGDYKFVIGDQNVNVTTNVLTNILKPIVITYNQSKSSSLDSIPIQGHVVGEYTPARLSVPTTINDSYGNIFQYFPLNTNLTIVMDLDSGYTNVGQWTDQSNGVTVNGYQSYLNVVVIYWPEMKIAGYHSFTGPSIPDTLNQYGNGDIYGDQVNDSTVTDWIAAQPKI